MNTSIAVVCLDDTLRDEANRCAQRLKRACTQALVTDFSLVFDKGRAVLRAKASKTGDIYVDFTAGASAHRRKYGGGFGQAVARACGVSGLFQPSVFDATAGLGQDAFVLASLGSQVTMMERSPVAFSLLSDGLRRARQTTDDSDPQLLETLANMTLLEGDSIEFLKNGSIKSEVIYLDPMFPAKQKQALAKKEMSAFQTLIGADLDEGELLAAALDSAQYRVVVKRPRLAEPISGPQPSASQLGKSSRFDIYGLKKLPSPQ